MAERLDGTVALITGASSGLGAESARMLASLGASVALVARRKDKLDEVVAEIVKAGGAAVAIEADITDRTQAEHAVAATVNTYGRLDTLINNAGVMLLGNVEGTDPDEWDRMIKVNTSGMLYVTGAAIPHLKAAAKSSPRKVADLINISSSAGHQAYAINGVYALTKFGVNGYTESLRQELAPQGVRVHTLAPGAVATELFGHNTPEVQEMLSSDAFEPMAPADIAEAVEFIVTRPARASVNYVWIGPTGQL
ncbi:SDR family oxidoreductase [Rhodococcus erythropolis]|uniref:SDR family oxidoreductase n=1 Tax=Rhodococcus erythropolis TaxID=1833 RepID=UPI002226DA48|nr:SDR family NAD(P)-dependent oxidoreductase [Rhodococcus erythropolis]MCW2295459.1 NADP-dependent 3-hydroxy acid dehydrogenase YdfG [Rhodococcus erythropolis]